MTSRGSSNRRRVDHQRRPSGAALATRTLMAPRTPRCSGCSVSFVGWPALSSTGGPFGRMGEQRQDLVALMLTSSGCPLVASLGDPTTSTVTLRTAQRGERSPTSMMPPASAASAWTHPEPLAWATAAQTARRMIAPLTVPKARSGRARPHRLDARELRLERFTDVGKERSRAVPARQSPQSRSSPAVRPPRAGDRVRLRLCASRRPA